MRIYGRLFNVMRSPAHVDLFWILTGKALCHNCLSVLQLQRFGSFSVESKASQIVVSLLGRLKEGK